MVATEKMTKNLGNHSATQETIDELRRLGYAVKVHAIGGVDQGKQYFWIKANVHATRLRTIDGRGA